MASGRRQNRWFNLNAIGRSDHFQTLAIVPGQWSIRIFARPTHWSWISQDISWDATTARRRHYPNDAGSAVDRHRRHSDDANRNTLVAPIGGAIPMATAANNYIVYAHSQCRQQVRPDVASVKQATPPCCGPEPAGQMAAFRGNPHFWWQAGDRFAKIAVVIRQAQRLLYDLVDKVIYAAVPPSQPPTATIQRTRREHSCRFTSHPAGS